MFIFGISGSRENGSPQKKTATTMQCVGSMEEVACCVPVADIKDVYLLGFMITGALLIGLGVALVYRKIKSWVSC